MTSVDSLQDISTSDSSNATLIDSLQDVTIFNGSTATSVDSLQNARPPGGSSMNSIGSLDADPYYNGSSSITKLDGSAEVSFIEPSSSAEGIINSPRVFVPAVLFRLSSIFKPPVARLTQLWSGGVNVVKH